MVRIMQRPMEFLPPTSIWHVPVHRVCLELEYILLNRLASLMSTFKASLNVALRLSLCLSAVLLLVMYIIVTKEGQTDGSWRHVVCDSSGIVFWVIVKRRLALFASLSFMT